MAKAMQEKETELQHLKTEVLSADLQSRGPFDGFVADVLLTDSRGQFDGLQSKSPFDGSQSRGPFDGFAPEPQHVHLKVVR